MVGFSDIKGSVLMLSSDCRVCGNKDISIDRTKGFVEKNLLWIIRLSPYRCGECRTRFYRFNFLNGLESTKRVKQRRRKTSKEESLTELVNPMDEKEFNELIAKIGESEREIFGKVESQKIDG
tara:strand:- start:172 stop:540 length:369 start_codon:yes stop_codon:yes gene_type:complete